MDTEDAVTRVRVVYDVVNGPSPVATIGALYTVGEPSIWMDGL